MARAALCSDGLRSSQCAQLLPTLLLASLLVHDALLLLVALLRPSSVSAAYLALCLLGYQGTSSSEVTVGRLVRLAAAAAAAAVGLGLGLADSTALEQSPAAWAADLIVFIDSAALCTAATRRWLGPSRRRPLFHEAWGHALFQELERHSQPVLLLLLLLLSVLRPCALALPVLLPAVGGLFAWAMRAERPLAWLRCLASLSQPYLAAWALALYVQQLLLRLGQQQRDGPPQVTSCLLARVLTSYSPTCYSPTSCFRLVTCLLA